MQKNQSSPFSQHKNAPKRFQSSCGRKKHQPDFHKMTVFVLKVTYQKLKDVNNYGNYESIPDRNCSGELASEHENCKKLIKNSAA